LRILLFVRALGDGAVGRLVCRALLNFQTSDDKIKWVDDDIGDARAD